MTDPTKLTDAEQAARALFGQLAACHGTGSGAKLKVLQRFIEQERAAAAAKLAEVERDGAESNGPHSRQALMQSLQLARDHEAALVREATEARQTITQLKEEEASTRAYASDMERRVNELEEAAREVLSAAHLRTHGFPEGDISDLDFSKMLPAIVRLDAALAPQPAENEEA